MPAFVARPAVMVLTALLLAAAPLGPVLAEGFTPLRDKAAFVALIENKNLKRLGITLRVLPDGAITGKALGQKVRGAWQWKDGYFCRDLYWGNENLGANCQEVSVRGRTLRFQSDRGTGDYADLSLD